VPIRIAVVDENEVFRRGVVACLAEKPGFEVTCSSERPLLVAVDAHVVGAIDVAVVSARAARDSDLPCALVVCSGIPGAHSDDSRVLAVLPRNALTSDQLVAAVQGAAVGLKISCQDTLLPQLDDRRLRILRLLADGANTREISESLRYSQRTIKGLVASIEGDLGCRTRAQAVATAIRSELI